MKGSFLFLIVASFASNVLACDQPTKHYTVMGCTPSEQKNAQGCPLSYDCPNLSYRQKDKCYLFGKTYAIGESVPHEETASTCTAALACIDDGDDSARFIFAYVDCAEFFRPWNQSCVRQYQPNSCCSSGEVCGDDRNALATCTEAGQTYYEGERMPVLSDPCKTCICTKGAKKCSLSDNDQCYEQKCIFELFNAEQLYGGAAPVYKAGYCCPWDWRLPTETDKVVKGPYSSAHQNLQCIYGNNTLNVGDWLEPFFDGQGSYRCNCAIPPLVTCELFTALD